MSIFNQLMISSLELERESWMETVDGSGSEVVGRFGHVIVSFVESSES